MSVPLLIASLRLCLQPYLLSFFALVTESLTLIAGILSSPFSSISFSLCTPVVVSSETPWIFSSISGNFAWTIDVRSLPSSRIIFASHGLPSLQIVCSIHHSYSSSVSPFHANVGIPFAAIAAAAWSCVEKMLQDDHLNSAPRSTRVSIKTAVWIVMCMHPIIFAPASGCSSRYLSLKAINAGISFSANEISLLPNSARLISATL